MSALAIRAPEITLRRSGVLARVPAACLLASQRSPYAGPPHARRRPHRCRSPARIRACDTPRAVVGVLDCVAPRLESGGSRRTLSARSLVEAPREAQRHAAPLVAPLGIPPECPWPA